MRGMQGKLDEAEPLYRRIQSIVGKTLGDEDPMYAATLNNRAGLYDSQASFIVSHLDVGLGFRSFHQSTSKHSMHCNIVLDCG